MVCRRPTERTQGKSISRLLEASKTGRVQDACNSLDKKRRSAKESLRHLLLCVSSSSMFTLESRQKVSRGLRLQQALELDYLFYALHVPTFRTSEFVTGFGVSRPK